MVTRAGIYQLPLQEYVRDPAPEPSMNSGTALALLTQSPKHAWVQHPRLNPAYSGDASSRLDIGTIAHALLIEGDESKVVAIDADDWRTKAAKEQRDAARQAGKLPILKDDFLTVKLMVSIAVDAIYGSELCKLWMEAQPEQTLIWQESGVWCRSRPDKLSRTGAVYFDYKTTIGTAHPGLFAKGPLIRHGYDLQAVIGMRGVRALKHTECRVVFIVQEMELPHAVSFVSLSPQFEAVANERLELALYQWRDCLNRKSWPGYPQRVAYVDPPSYYGMETADDYLPSSR